MAEGAMAEGADGAPRVATALGRQLRTWREGHRLTQRAVAERLGWKHTAVARLEGGAVAPTATTLALLVERLGVSIRFHRGEGGTAVVVEVAETERGAT